MSDDRLLFAVAAGLMVALSRMPPAWPYIDPLLLGMGVTFALLALVRRN